MPKSVSYFAGRLRQKFVLDPAGFGRPVPAAAFDEEYRSGQWDHFLGFEELTRNSVLAGAINHFFPRPAILDVGCGSGRLAALCSYYPRARYLGIDLSTEALSRARQLNLPDTEFAAGDFEHWRPTGHFDAIIFNESIGYARDPAATMTDFCAYLTPGGRFFLSLYRSGHYKAQWRRLDRVTRVVAATTVTSPQRRVWDVKVLEPRTIQQAR